MATLHGRSSKKMMEMKLFFQVKAQYCSIYFLIVWTGALPVFLTVQCFPVKFYLYFTVQFKSLLLIM